MIPTEVFTVMKHQIEAVQNDEFNISREVRKQLNGEDIALDRNEYSGTEKIISGLTAYAAEAPDREALKPQFGKNDRPQWGQKSRL